MTRSNTAHTSCCSTPDHEPFKRTYYDAPRGRRAWYWPRCHSCRKLKGKSHHTLCRHCRVAVPKAGIAVPCGHCGTTLDRDALIVGLYFADVTQRQIAATFGLTPRTVRAIIGRWLRSKSKQSVALRAEEA